MLYLGETEWEWESKIFFQETRGEEDLSQSKTKLKKHNLNFKKISWPCHKSPLK